MQKVICIFYPNFAQVLRKKTRPLMKRGIIFVLHVFIDCISFVYNRTLTRYSLTTHFNTQILYKADFAFQGMFMAYGPHVNHIYNLVFLLAS